MKKKFFFVIHPIFHIKICFYFGYTFNELNERWGDLDVEGNTDGKCWQLDNGVINIWIDEKSLNKQDTYLHELHHANEYLMELLGINDKETKAYNFVYLVETYIEGLKKYRLKKKKK